MRGTQRRDIGERGVDVHLDVVGPAVGEMLLDLADRVEVDRRCEQLARST